MPKQHRTKVNFLFAGATYLLLFLFIAQFSVGPPSVSFAHLVPAGWFDRYVARSQQVKGGIHPGQVTSPSQDFMETVKTTLQTHTITHSYLFTNTRTWGRFSKKKKREHFGMGGGSFLFWVWWDGNKTVPKLNMENMFINKDIYEQYHLFCPLDTMQHGLLASKYQWKSLIDVVLFYSNLFQFYLFIWLLRDIK